jgi:ketosteroid isomerase-like protein
LLLVFGEASDHEREPARHIGEEAPELLVVCKRPHHFDLLHPRRVESRTGEGWPEPGPFVGRDAVMRQLKQQRETWDSDAFELITDFIGAADRVVVRFIWRAAGRGPDVPVEATGIYTVRKGKIFAIEHFWDHAEALEAVGLSEQDAYADS